MKILFAAINSRYNHTNLAIRSIACYAEKNLSCKKASSTSIEIAEYTINQQEGDILRSIYGKSPDIILFSVYIWNVEMTLKIIAEIKKILPNVIIALGGPEVSYRNQEILEQNPNVDFVICGEGEITTLEAIHILSTDTESRDNLIHSLSMIPGVKTRTNILAPRVPMQNLDSIPFAYTDNELSECADTKIFYYESSRGCPFRCSYCLSSIDKSMRYRCLDQVFADLKRFLDAGVKLVKFVDRTFNLNEERTIAIWDFLRKNHNGKTMFHFEIEAHTLTQKMLDAIANFPAGIMQFEIGVQSTNPKTLEEIGRQTDFQKIRENVKRIPKTIHQHLDLIAGLPHENLESFGKSFDDVIGLRPDMLQLGFLKVLSGTKMADYASGKIEYKFLDTPPYEVLTTPWLSYSDILFLKDLEKLLDIYYNSGNFPKTIEFLFRLKEASNLSASPNSKDFSFFGFFSELTRNFRQKGIFENACRETEYFAFLIDFLSSTVATEIHETACAFFDENSCKILRDTLRFDFISAQKTSNFPAWYEHRYDKDSHRDALNQHTEVTSTRESYAHSEYETFDFDMENFDSEKTAYLFLYDSVKGKTKNRYWIRLDKRIKN